MSKPKFAEGQHVKLKADEEEGFPEEFGVVFSVTKLPLCNMYGIYLDDKYKQDEYDDGIRECDEEQLEADK